MLYSFRMHYIPEARLTDEKETSPGGDTYKDSLG